MSASRRSTLFTSSATVCFAGLYQDSFSLVDCGAGGRTVSDVPTGPLSNDVVFVLHGCNIGAGSDNFAKSLRASGGFAFQSKGARGSLQRHLPSPEKSVRREKPRVSSGRDKANPPGNYSLRPEPPGGVMEVTKSLKHFRKRPLRGSGSAQAIT